MSSSYPDRSILPDMNVAIIGAGIAGLTAALLLAQKGARISLFEQAERLEDIGAGIQISPNAARILDQIEVLKQLQATWVEPDHIALRDGKTLHQIADVPVKQLSKTVWNAPYAVLPRSELQNALLDQLNHSENCRLHLSQTLDFSSQPTLLQDLSNRMGCNEIEVVPDLIIGADGVHSQTRSLIVGSGQKRTTDYVAWRLRVEHTDMASRCPELAHENNVHVLMSAKAHLAIYPKDQQNISQGASHNIVFVTRRVAKGTLSDQITQLDLHSGIKSCLLLAQSSGQWPIFEVTQGHWHYADNDQQPPIVLIGDAAHAMQPFMAQGAAMAIEDGASLCAQISNFKNNIKIATQTYVIKRKIRIDKVKKRTDFNRVAYHARGPLKLGRNLVLGLKPPKSLGRDLDWLYGWQVENDV